MTRVFPAVLSTAKCGYIVSIPDLEIDTQGTDIADAILMARDAIGLWGITQIDLGNKIPEPSTVEPNHEHGELVTWVDIDFDEYRRRHDNRTVRRNITLPAWLDEAASKANINVSGFIQNALKAHLGVNRA